MSVSSYSPGWAGERSGLKAGARVWSPGRGKCLLIRVVVMEGLSGNRAGRVLPCTQLAWFSPRCPTCPLSTASVIP